MEKLKKILIKPDNTVKQALKHMDAMGEKTLIAIDGKNKILGTVTDGDIRRWILRKKSLGVKITKVMNRQPLTLKKGFRMEQAKALMLESEIECLPVVNVNREVISSVWWTDFFKKKPKHNKLLRLPVVIMAGGEGIRLSPFTKVLPKPLIPIGDKPVIELIIERFLQYGCSNFFFSLNYKSNMIKAYFNDFEHSYKINYLLENKPLGTIGSLHLLKKEIKKTFFVVNCDVLIEADYSDMLKFHRQQGNKITIISSMKNFTIPYGVCEIQSGGILRNIHEKPEQEFLVNTGMYILDPSVISDVPQNRFCNMTDLIKGYLKRNEKIGVYPVSEKAWLDIGQIETLYEALKKFEG